MFACIPAMRRDGESVEDIRHLAGLARTQPHFALALAALILSLAGLPPLAGIFAKVYVFAAAMQAHLYIPAIINIVASVVGAFYYLRIVKIMYFDEPVRGFDHDIGRGTNAIMWGTSAISIFFVFVPAPLDRDRRHGRARAVPVNWPQGLRAQDVRRHQFHERGSKAPGRGGRARPIWISAARQTAGRGRRGRSWESPAGNLAATLLLRPGQTGDANARSSRSSPPSRRATCWRTSLRHAEVRVKWPNDVLADGRKIAGILLESASQGGEAPGWLAIGIGINLATHPDGTEFPATSLAALGRQAGQPPTTRCFISRPTSPNGMTSGAAKGFAAIRDAWLARAAGLGGRIRARLDA